MATQILYSTETANLGNSPPTRVSDVAQRGRVKILRNTIAFTGQDYDAQTNVVFALGSIPNAARFKGVTIVTDTSLGSTTFGIGTVAGTFGGLSAPYADLVAAGKTLTATETPTSYGLVSARGAAAFSADTPIYMRILAADLPGSGTMVVDVEYIES